MMENADKILWRVYNRHPLGYTHKEKFKGDVIEIKAGEFVLMDYFEANEFRGQYFPISYDGMEQQDPISYKCIELVPDSTKVVVEEKPMYICNADGRKFETEEAYLDHLKKNYSDKFYVDESLEREIKNKKGKI